MKQIIKIQLIVIISLLIFSYNTVFSQENTSNLSQQKEAITLLYNSNDIEETLRTISKIPENERDSEIWFILANLTQDANEEDDAVFYLQKAILTDKTNDKAYYNLGNIYQSREQYYNALKMYKAAIKLKRDFAPYYYNLGCAYFSVEDFKNAKNSFKRAVILSNSDANYRYNLALTYKKLGDEKNAQKELDIYNKLTQE